MKQPCSRKMFERDQLIDALDIMDTKGRRNQENNSILLWSKDWDRLRGILIRMLAGSDGAKVG